MVEQHVCCSNGMNVLARCLPMKPVRGPYKGHIEPFLDRCYLGDHGPTRGVIPSKGRREAHGPLKVGELFHDFAG